VEYREAETTILTGGDGREREMAAGGCVAEVVTRNFSAVKPKKLANQVNQL